jgi:hypothetical protein
MTPTAYTEIGRAVIAVFIMALTLAFSARLITVDHYVGTYGVSIGTNNNYCSVEDKLPVVTCEHAN